MKRLAPLFSALVLLTLAGCNILPEPTPDPTRFYALPETIAEAPATGGITLGLLPVAMPAYLTSTRAMTVAGAANQITYRDFDRWAEPLDDGISRVLRSALTAQPGIARVVSTPFAIEDARKFDLRIRVHHCEGLASGGIRFALSYEVLATDGTLVANGIYRAPFGDWNGEPGALAGELARAVNATASAIAADLP